MAPEGAKSFCNILDGEAIYRYNVNINLIYNAVFLAQVWSS